MDSLRIAIVGCGKIADQHVAAIHRIPNCDVVALCDRELLMARQLGERAKVTQCFADVGDMLKQVRPAVVHITTPPQSHFALAQQCFAAGSHVYLEKPFTVTAEEAEAVVQMALKSNLKLTAGHNYQFTPEMIQMRRLVNEGYLGGKPVHLESHWGYSLEDTTYVGPLLGSKDHWVRRLPGQLFHNLISHGVAKLAEFLEDDLVEVVARAHQSPRMRNLGGHEVLDELRVMIRDAKGTTAFFCFSTQIKPGLTQLRVCGTANSLMADYVSGSLIRENGRSCKSYLTYFVPPLRRAKEHLRSARLSFTSFLGRRLYQDSGMKELIERFCNSIRTSGPPPIPYREIILTAQIMDEIFKQVYQSNEVSRNATEMASLK